MLIEWSLLIEVRFFIDVSAFGESLSFGCPKESNQRKGHLAAIAPQAQGTCAQQPLLFRA
jgi:hypothetical protein